MRAEVETLWDFFLLAYECSTDTQGTENQQHPPGGYSKKNSYPAEFIRSACVVDDLIIHLCVI